jgi:hypothetical protein
VPVCFILKKKKEEEKKVALGASKVAQVVA